MSMVTRAGTLARKTRRRSGGTAYRFGNNRYHHYNHHNHHQHQHHHHRTTGASRRASAPILTPHYPRFVRVPSPISRSAETVALPIPSPSPQHSPSKSVSFSTEVEEVLIAPRPDTLSVHTSIAYILQMIRLFLLMGFLLPCALHSQVRMFAPNLCDTPFCLAVVATFIGNIIISTVLSRIFKSCKVRCLLKILPFYGKGNTCPTCCQKEGCYIPKDPTPRQCDNMENEEDEEEEDEDCYPDDESENW